MEKKVTAKNLPALCRRLAERDEQMDFIFQTFGTPPLWSREASFATLIQIILEQQVSLASAAAAFEKLKTRIGAVTPENLLRLSDEELKACYFSRQKTGYARNLARAISDENLVLQNLSNLPDALVREELTKIKGIGRWTADIFLLMALRRADIMPRGDIALHTAFQKISKAEKRPTAEEFLEIAEKWKPLRSVAARLLWHFYLSERTRAKADKKKKSRKNLA